MRGRDQQMYQIKATFDAVYIYIYLITRVIIHTRAASCLFPHEVYRVACCSNALILIKVHCGY